MAIRLTEQTILNMRGQTALFVKITDEFGLNSLETIRRWMRANKPNGPLTSKTSLNIISKALNVPEHLLLETISHELNPKRSISAESALSG